MLELVPCLLYKYHDSSGVGYRAKSICNGCMWLCDSSCVGWYIVKLQWLHGGDGDISRYYLLRLETRRRQEKHYMLEDFERGDTIH
jgi:hypothetical protein